MSTKKILKEAFTRGFIIKLSIITILTFVLAFWFFGYTDLGRSLVRMTI